MNELLSQHRNRMAGGYGRIKEIMESANPDIPRALKVVQEMIRLNRELPGAHPAHVQNARRLTVIRGGLSSLDTRQHTNMKSKWLETNLDDEQKKALRQMIIQNCIGIVRFEVKRPVEKTPGEPVRKVG